MKGQELKTNTLLFAKSKEKNEYLFLKAIDGEPLDEKAILRLFHQMILTRFVKTTHMLSKNALSSDFGEQI